MRKRSVASMKAGVAEVEITPPIGLPMWGYAARKDPARGVLDPLYARVLVLESGLKRLALVVLDFGRTFGAASLVQLRGALKARYGINCLIVSATHTHSGPVIQEEYAEGVPPWEQEVLEKITLAVGTAVAGLQEVRLGIGYGHASIAHNRLRIEPNGTVTWFSSNPQRIPTAPVDPTVTVLRLDTREGEPLAILAHHACHPVVLDAVNLNYSADFPGVTVRMVREAFDNKPICFFLQGATGDINPYYAHLPPLENEIKLKDWTGLRLGEEVIRVASSIHTESWSEADIRFTEESLRFRPRYQPEAWRAAIKGFGEEFARWFTPRMERESRVPLTTVLIGKRLALMTVPGEPFVEFQQSWRECCPVQDSLLLGYANGYFGYFPTIRAAAYGGYGASGPTAWIEVGAGERLVNQAVIRVYEMLGQLKPRP